MREPLFTRERADGAFLRHGLQADLDHVVAAVGQGVYSNRDALHFLITTALSRAERAKIAPEIARFVAVSAFHERMTEHLERLNAVRWQIVNAVRAQLDEDPEDFDAAAAAGSAIARAHQAPPGLLSWGVRFAARGR